MKHEQEDLKQNFRQEVKGGDLVVVMGGGGRGGRGGRHEPTVVVVLGNNWLSKGVKSVQQGISNSSQTKNHKHIPPMKFEKVLN